jgi:hypothetical protein
MDSSWILIAAIAIAVLGAIVAFVVPRGGSSQKNASTAATATKPARVFHTRQEEVDAAGLTVRCKDDRIKNNDVFDFFCVSTIRQRKLQSITKSMIAGSSSTIWSTM